MQSDVKEPPTLSDKCAVHEWVEMTHNQPQEILAGLIGKAKVVVMVNLCPNSYGNMNRMLTLPTSDNNTSECAGCSPCTRNPPWQFTPRLFQAKKCHVCGDICHYTLMHCKREKFSHALHSGIGRGTATDMDRTKWVSVMTVTVNLSGTRTPTLDEGKCEKWTRYLQ